MKQTESQALTKMCPKRSQFNGSRVNCIVRDCMAWRRDENCDRNSNNGEAWGWCAEYPEPRNKNIRGV